MKDKFSVIKINGFGGMFIALLLLGCIIQGIIVFPGWVLMHIWNFISSYIDQMPVMNLLHGIILWAIIALSSYAITKEKSPISYQTPCVLSDDDLKNILEKTQNSNTFTSVGQNQNSEEEIKH